MGGTGSLEGKEILKLGVERSSRAGLSILSELKVVLPQKGSRWCRIDSHRLTAY
jgi:hypothetical protein